MSVQAPELLTVAPAESVIVKVVGVTVTGSVTESGLPLLILPTGVTIAAVATLGLNSNPGGAVNTRVPAPEIAPACKLVISGPVKVVHAPPAVEAGIAPPP